MLNKPNASTASKTALNKKFAQLFALDKITLQDFDLLTVAEKHYFGKMATKKLAKLTGTERDVFLNKIELIITPDTRSGIWEENQLRINNTIANYIWLYGVMPSQSAIAAEAGLSRQTVVKHLKEYQTHPEHLAEMEQFKFMAPKVLSSVFKYALNSDMRAARLYFEMVGSTNKQQPNTLVTAHNNYIQVNNTILSQETLKQLSTEQLNQIESIVRKEDVVRLGRVGLVDGPV